MATIDYFYSAHSSYAYLGSARFMAIAKAGGRNIVHKPMDLDRVVEAAGSAPFAARNDAFRQYFFLRELQRWSEERGAPIQGRPTHHHNDMTAANCLLVAAALAGIDVDPLAHALLEAHWRFDADLADLETLARLANQAGCPSPGALLDAIATEPVRSAYAANTEEAIARSVFGSPTYFVDGDMFYGQDRLEMVERAIERPYAQDWSGAHPNTAG